MNAKINEQTPKMEVVRRETLFKLNTRNLFKFFSRSKKSELVADTSNENTGSDGNKSNVRIKFKQIQLLLDASTTNASFGFTIHGYCPCQVGKVEKNSISEQAGVMPGDLIIKINGRNVSRATCDSVVRLIKNGSQTLTLDLLRPCRLSEKKRTQNMYESIPICPPTNAVNSTENEMLVDYYNHLNEMARPKKAKNVTNKKHKYSNRNRPKIGRKNGAENCMLYSMPSPIPHMSPESKKTSIITDSDYKTQSSAGTEEHANISSSAASYPTSSDDHHLCLCEKLLNLEEKFIDIMQKGVQQYSRPLRHCLMIDQSQHCTIFQNIEKILAISEYQLNQLISQDDSILLDMFNTIGKLYENKIRMSSEAFDIYLNGIEKAINLLNQLNANSNLSKFLSEAKDDIDMDLKTFLLIPIYYVNEIVQCLNKIKDNTSPVSSDYQFLVNLTHSLQPYCQRSKIILVKYQLDTIDNPLKNFQLFLDQVDEEQEEEAEAEETEEDEENDFQEYDECESKNQTKLNLIYSGCVQYRQSCNKWKRIRLLFFHDRIILLSYNSNVDKFISLLSKSCSNSWSILDSLNEFTFKSISFKNVMNVHFEQTKSELSLKYSRAYTGSIKTNKIKLKCSSSDNQRWNQLFTNYLCDF